MRTLCGVCIIVNKTLTVLSLSNHSSATVDSEGLAEMCMHGRPVAPQVARGKDPIVQRIELQLTSALRSYKQQAPQENMSTVTGNGPGAASGAVSSHVQAE